MKKLLYALILSFLYLNLCYADGSSIDKVYLPYVQPLEKELEYRVLHERYNSDELTSTKHKLGYGMAVNERWFTEVYVIGEELDNQSLDLKAYEIEAKWQLTEQGEFAYDWGFLFELEKYDALNIWEAKVGLLVVKDWQKISAVANAYLIREWGSDIENESEVAAALQLRYRLTPMFEPGLEYFSSEETQAVGPVIMGELRVGAQQKLFWQLGYIIGLNHDTADKTIKLQLEYEFL